MTRMRWELAGPRETEADRPREAPVPGPQTHVKRAPCYRVLPDGSRVLVEPAQRSRRNSPDALLYRRADRAVWGAMKRRGDGR